MVSAVIRTAESPAGSAALVAYLARYPATFPELMSPSAVMLTGRRSSCGPQFMSQPAGLATRSAHAQYMRRVRAEGRILGTHGTETAYDTGCRCDQCREAHNAKSRNYKAKR